MGHHLLDQAPERLDPGLGLHPVEEVGVMDVPGRRQAARGRLTRLRGAGRSGASRRIAAPRPWFCSPYLLQYAVRPTMFSSGAQSIELA